MRLIDADALKKRGFSDPDTKSSGEALVYVQDIDETPTIEAEPVRHGRWEPMLDRVWNLPNPVLSGWRCSECGRTENEKDPYCNCGCKMDGDDHEA